MRLILSTEWNVSLNELKHALIALCKVILGTLVLLLLYHLS